MSRPKRPFWYVAPTRAPAESKNEQLKTVKKFYKGELLTFRVSKNSTATLGCVKVAPRPGKYFFKFALANFDCQEWSAHPVLQFRPPKKRGCPKNEARKMDNSKTVKKIYKGELLTFRVSKNSAAKLGCAEVAPRPGKYFFQFALANFDCRGWSAHPVLQFRPREAKMNNSKP